MQWEKDSGRIKIGAGAVGLFVAWPAITAGMGAYKQKKLPGEVFQVIENCSVAGGKTVTVNGAGAKVEQGMIVCPGCKAQVPSGARFYNHCRASLCTKCPACGGGGVLRTAPFARRADKSCKE